VLNCSACGRPDNAFVQVGMDDLCSYCRALPERERQPDKPGQNRTAFCVTKIRRSVKLTGVK